MVTSQGSNVRRRVRGEMCRRTWTAKEEEVLLESLKDMISQGYKSENGFKGGYLLALEGLMRKAFPETDLKANPHIKSRLTTWKKNYASLTTILSRSGVGFNLNGDFQVNCDKAEWEEIMKIDNNASNIYKRSWPLLEGWKEVFGKDRATGDGAEDVMETLNEFLHEFNEEANKDDNTTRAAAENVNHGATQNKDKNIHNEEEDPSVCNSSKLGPSSSQSKKKRKVDDGSANMCDVLGQIQRDMNARFDSLINRIGYHVDVAQMRKEVYKLIKNIPDLSVTASFTACDKIIGKVERLEFFMGLPESDRASYVQYVLGLDD